MIEAKDVSCTFARNPFSKEGFMAVSPVSIQFIDGERYAIVGESGSGKTTLARMIAGLQRPTTGNIYVDGMPVYGKHKVHTNYFKEVQIIQQDSSSALDPKMSVGRSIEEPLLCFFHLDKGERKKRCHDLMDLCNLPVEYYSRLPAELSGGEQKRVAIARALAAEPKCLIFDEATNGFDLPLRKKIIEEIVDLQRKLAFTLIFITHDMELAVVIADVILVMRNSTLIEQVEFSGDISVFTSEYSKTLLYASGITDTYEVAFEDVTFAYDNTDHPAVSHLTFMAKAGAITALVGHSGSGKSTAASLIPRFYDVQDGAVKIGGVDIREIPQGDLMKMVAFVFQDPKLFKDSLLENIRAGRPSATREEVLKAAHLAQCDDILKKLPNGIDTIIGSQGIYLSGGETQRISIARAILKDAPIVVLDEATAYADPENEHQIQKAFDGLIKNKTVIMVAHRLSTVQDADQILVMKNGAIAESGTHSDLIKHQGEYAKMWDNYNKTVQWHIES